MDKTYDIFEQFPDQSLMWRSSASGTEKARIKLNELAAASPNEFQLWDVEEKEVIARANEQSLEKPIPRNCP